MKISKEDVRHLSGKFIIQISSDGEDVVLCDSNWPFYREKRISFICGLQWAGFYYNHMSFETEEEFVMYFNDYLTVKTKPEDVEKRRGERFHRLLTSKEIEFVCNKMKESNF